ncbi:MAG: hypothetical protein QM523_10040 [Candidatus Pacebacteria bacterium]|nr:hypothetical protein [Candidatus Paceibacterota bacterium]
MTRLLKPLLLLSLLLLMTVGLNGCNWWHETVGGGIKEYGHIKDYNPEVIPLLYCYRTRGSPECYREPQPGQEGRLVSEPKKRKAAQPDNSNPEPAIVFDPPTVAPPADAPPTMAKDQIAPVDAPTPITQ